MRAIKQFLLDLQSQQSISDVIRLKFVDTLVEPDKIFSVAA